jgi:hypothetical protein
MTKEEATTGTQAFWWRARNPEDQCEPRELKENSGKNPILCRDAKTSSNKNQNRI